MRYDRIIPMVCVIVLTSVLLGCGGGGSATNPRAMGGGLPPKVVPVARLD